MKRMTNTMSHNEDIRNEQDEKANNIKTIVIFVMSTLYGPRRELSIELLKLFSTISLYNIHYIV